MIMSIAISVIAIINVTDFAKAVGNGFFDLRLLACDQLLETT